MKTGRYSFSQLLNSPEIEQIIIPEIQRDYVWNVKNVDGLLNSIFSKYESKTKINLVIQTDEGEVSGQLGKYLTKEYSRLCFSTKIGFIYAYHDFDYPGKFFLIDGQQRITTLFLLLLALYSKQKDKWDYFRQHYFSQNLPKLDYRVREITHDFMVSLIDHELRSPEKKFEKENVYYGNLYDNDITTKTINDNYQAIKELINERGDSLNISELIDYLENYVEFNFFDTNISSQGERLYLYMNSRGESLSYQETIKALLISKCNDTDKDEFGLLWEKWQDFFWNHRGNNRNADEGLQNFIKWSVILHMCSVENVIIKDADVKNKGKQSYNEIKEDYIRVEQDREKNQTQFDTYIMTYIRDNDFSPYWLNNVMSAIKRLSNLEKEIDIFHTFIHDGWLSKTTNTIDYVTLLGVLRFLMRFPSADAKHIKRLGMFLKNKTYDGSRRKNPDAAAIASINMVNSIPQEDFMASGPYSLCSPFDEKVFSLIRNNEEWEQALYIFVQDTKLEDFLEGDASCLLLCGESPEEFVKNIKQFKNNILSHKEDAFLRKELLRYGDYSIDEKGGSHHLTKPDWLQRANWITNDDEWRLVLNKKDFVEKNLNPYLKGDTPSISQGEWFDWFIDDDFDLFVGKYKFLYNEDLNRIIILNGAQAGEFNSWYMETMIFEQLFNKMLPSNVIWKYKYDTCVIPFVIKEGALSYLNENETPYDQRSNYFIDLVFTWKDNGESRWDMALGKRNYEVTEKVNDWGFVKKDNKLWKKVYKNNCNLNLKENIQTLIAKLMEMGKSELPKYVNYFFESPELYE